MNDITRQGCAVVTVEFLGVDRKLEVLTDSAPAEPVNDYPGYCNIVSVKLGGVEIIKALDQDDLDAIKEGIK